LIWLPPALKGASAAHASFSTCLVESARRSVGRASRQLADRRHDVRSRRVQLEDDKHLEGEAWLIDNTAPGPQAGHDPRSYRRKRRS
jgi:hypothetical protein